MQAFARRVGRTESAILVSRQVQMRSVKPENSTNRNQEEKQIAHKIEPGGSHDWEIRDFLCWNHTATRRIKIGPFEGHPEGAKWKVRLAESPPQPPRSGRSVGERAARERVS